jgi:hypothetical protein
MILTTRTLSTLNCMKRKGEGQSGLYEEKERRKTHGTRVLRHDSHDRLRHQTREKVFRSVLLGGESGLEGESQAFGRQRGFEGANSELCREKKVSKAEEGKKARRRTLELLNSLIPRKLVTENDLRRVKTHGEEVLRLAEHLTSEDEDEVGTVAHLFRGKRQYWRAAIQERRRPARNCSFPSRKKRCLRVLTSCSCC